ncbi:MAG: GvpL/GvpF family gas vesicle protein [Nitrospirae bacterium]|nr:GvpL/GvpF family gas vesicle protein [Nitrospirota bacterium]
MADKELIYLYCVTNNMPQLKRNMKGVYFIYHEGLYAVVSKVPEDEFNEEDIKKNLTDMEWLDTKVRLHENIIEGVMKNNCVVPFKFATVFNTENRMIAEISELAEELRDNLRYFEGKEEWGIKIYCDMACLNNFLSREDEKILDMDKEISSSPPGKAFFLKKRREEILNDMTFVYAQDFLDMLKKAGIHVCINRLLRLLPKEITCKDDEMILNAACLVNKKGMETFINMVDAMRTQYGRCGFSFDCTGPWPPYNFCNLRLERVQRGKKYQAV